MCRVMFTHRGSGFAGGGSGFLEVIKQGAGRPLCTSPVERWVLQADSRGNRAGSPQSTATKELNRQASGRVGSVKGCTVSSRTGSGLWFLREQAGVWGLAVGGGGGGGLAWVACGGGGGGGGEAACGWGRPQVRESGSLQSPQRLLPVP